MQQLLEYFAVIAFVAVYFLTKDVFLATGVLLAVIVAQVAFLARTWCLECGVGIAALRQ